MFGRALPGGMNLTLVAFYGEKPAALSAWLAAAQAALAKLGPALVAYRSQQVHATVIGLEAQGALPGGPVLNGNYQALRGETRPMDLAFALDVVRRSPLIPFTIRIGGFESARDYSFTSRGEHPFARSFSLQGQTAVAMGWPHVNGGYSNALAELRRELERANVLHKYHARPEDSDNDFFFVLGRIARSELSDDVLQTTTRELRAFMAERPLELEVRLEHLAIVGYVDSALPLESSVSYPLASADPDQLRTLYRLVR